MRFDTDAGQDEKAIDRLKSLGGLSQQTAEATARGIIAGGIAHAFELINGSGPVPTSMATTRADQLRWVCEEVGRMFSQREVEIAFRVTPTTAKTILNTMLATYEESLRDKFLERMRTDVTVLASGTEEEGLTWTLRFSESSTFDAAWSELVRLGLQRECEVSSSARKIVVPRTFGGDESRPVLDALGIQEGT